MYLLDDDFHDHDNDENCDDHDNDDDDVDFFLQEVKPNSFLPLGNLSSVSLASNLLQTLPLAALSLGIIRIVLVTIVQMNSVIIIVIITFFILHYHHLNIMTKTIILDDFQLQRPQRVGPSSELEATQCSVTARWSSSSSSS